MEWKQLKEQLVDLSPEQLAEVEALIEELKESTHVAQQPSAGKAFYFGCMAGKLSVPDDFNEPLEDFKPYMY